MNGDVPIAERMSRALPTQRILWGALFASTIALYVVGRAGFDAPSEPPSPLFGPLLFAVASCCGGFGIAFPWMTLAATLKRRPPTPAIVMTPAILGLALSEAMGFVGLMLNVIHAPGGYAPPLFFIAWILFAARFPTATRPLGLLGPVLDLTDPGTEPGALR